MKIDKTLVITDIPWITRIVVQPAAEYPIRLDSDESADLIPAFSLEQIEELRDALTLAIDHVRDYREPPKLPEPTPVRLFTPGQSVTVEDIAKLPVGTHLVDDENSPGWRVLGNGFLSYASVEWRAEDAFRRFAPFTIVSLPGGES
jgi:hypothetical protein